MEVSSSTFALFGGLTEFCFSFFLSETRTKINISNRRLLSVLETYGQHVILDELEKSFVQTNLAVSIVDQPNNRTKPIIGFAYGLYHWPSASRRTSHFAVARISACPSQTSRAYLDDAISREGHENMTNDAFV